MKKYFVHIDNREYINFKGERLPYFISKSRDSVKHLAQNGGEHCIVADRRGNIISEAISFVDGIKRVIHC